MKKAKHCFKKPPKRYQPRGLSILYEDRDILVVNKVSGLLTVSTEKVRENTAYYLLTDYVRKGNQKSHRRLFIVHRLDKDTSGVLLFAKSPQAKRFLQEAWHDFSKTYYAIVHGAMEKPEGVITSILAENKAHKVYSIADPRKGKLAKTGYRVVRTSKTRSLLEIDLLTGRKNQIRVHLAEQGCPVVGDTRYGRKENGVKRLALHAASITIRHPHSKEPMTFEAGLPPYFESLLSGSCSQSPERDMKIVVASSPSLRHC